MNDLTLKTNKLLEKAKKYIYNKYSVDAEKYTEIMDSVNKKSQNVDKFHLLSTKLVVGLGAIGFTTLLPALTTNIDTFKIISYGSLTIMTPLLGINALYMLSQYKVSDIKKSLASKFYNIEDKPIKGYLEVITYNGQKQAIPREQLIEEIHIGTFNEKYMKIVVPSPFNNKEINSQDLTKDSLLRLKYYEVNPDNNQLQIKEDTYDVVEKQLETFHRNKFINSTDKDEALSYYASLYPEKISNERKIACKENFIKKIKERESNIQSSLQSTHKLKI